MQNHGVLRPARFRVEKLIVFSRKGRYGFVFCGERCVLDINSYKGCWVFF